jgi:DNA repair photolyase
MNGEPLFADAVIVSASRRTDIPAHYSQWFFSRINEGFAYAQNPMNPTQIRKIALTPDAVACFVFWTKNPAPMLKELRIIKDFSYYFHFTLTGYGRDIENALPQKSELLETFKKLSDVIGAHRVIWRYDPVLLNKTYSVEYHIECFEKTARALNGHTEKVVFSFIDFYKKIKENAERHAMRQITIEEKDLLAKNFSVIARQNNLLIDSCAESIDYCAYGISRGRCIDDRLASKIAGRTLPIPKDKNQRNGCGCAQSVDIGAYNTCVSGCAYCYANSSVTAAQKNYAAHTPHSPFLAQARYEKSMP